MKIKKREAICEYCGKVYLQKQSYQKYCSHECAKLGQPYYRNREVREKTCPICNNSFSTTKKRQKYCSTVCYNKANRAYQLQYRKKTIYPFLKIRFQVFERDKFRCRYCGRGPDDGVKLEIDHIMSKNNGGADDLSNYITACSDCNVGKGDVLLLANQKGQIPSFIRLKEKA